MTHWLYGLFKTGTDDWNPKGRSAGDTLVAASWKKEKLTMLKINQNKPTPQTKKLINSTSEKKEKKKKRKSLGYLWTVTKPNWSLTVRKNIWY